MKRKFDKGDGIVEKQEPVPPKGALLLVRAAHALHTVMSDKK